MVEKPDLLMKDMDILVVDDEVANLRLLTEILTLAGYRVRSAAEPELAMESALAYPPGLILLDVMMPDMDGFEVCQQLREHESTLDIPIIFVSALQSVEDRVRGFEAGGVDFISKPYQKSEILARVKTHLQLRKMQLNLEQLVSERTMALTKANQALKLEINERRQAEQKLRVSEERFRATFEQAAVGIAHVSPEGQFIRINQKFCDIVGYTQEEMLGFTFQDITHPDDLDDDLEQVELLLAGGTESYMMEKRYFRKDGEIVWVNLTVALLWGGTGEPRWFVAVVEDITARKQMELALHESEEKYRTLVEKANDGVVVIQDEQIKFANTSFARITGRTFQAILNSHFTDYLPAKDLSIIVDMYQKRDDQETPSIYQSTIQHKDGSCVEVEYSAALTAYADQPAVLVIVRDITERVRAEEELQASQRLLSLVIDNLPALVSYVDADHHFQFVNQRYEEYYGVPNSEIIGSHVQEILGSKGYAAARPYIAEVLAGETRSFEELYTYPELEERWMEVNYVPDRDFSGSIQGFVALIHDITRRKQDEIRIIKYQGRLKALVSQLTIAEEKERRVIAAELHDHIGQSLAFARIQLSTARKQASESERDAIIEAASQTLLQAIQETRSLVFGLSSPLLNQIGLGAAISEFLEAEVEQRHGIKTKYSEHEVAEPLPEDMRAILFRNVRELLNNVVKHANASQVSVHLEQDAKWITIKIEDNGVGFDPDATFQGINRDGAFGLFSIQERMNDLGGSLEINAQRGIGSQVILTAPTVFEGQL